MKFKLSIYRNGKYTEREFDTEAKARAYAEKHKTGQIVLCEVGNGWTYYKEVLKGNVKEVHKDDDFFLGDRLVKGKTLDEIFGQYKRICGQFVTRIDDNQLNIGKVRKLRSNIEKTDDGFVKITEYDVTRSWMRITKNEMMEYCFDDFFRRVEMTDEEEAFLRGQYSTAYTLTKPIDWDKWRRYEAACGGDIRFDEI